MVSWRDNEGNERIIDLDSLFKYLSSRLAAANSVFSVNIIFAREEFSSCLARRLLARSGVLPLKLPSRGKTKRIQSNLLSFIFIRLHPSPRP